MHTEVDSIHPSPRTWRNSRAPRSLLLAGLLAGSMTLSPVTARVHAAPVTVTVWDISQGLQEKEFVADADAFNKAHPDIHVQIQFFQNDPYKTKLQIAIGAHQGPDIFMGW